MERENRYPASGDLEDSNHEDASSEPRDAEVEEEYTSIELEMAKLLSRVRAPEDRRMFYELQTVVTAGAHRASWIMTWICAAESLRRRFSEMQVRDREAGEVAEEINRREREGGAVDVYVLDQAKEFGIVDARQYRQLSYLREMRNIYAHPGEERPSRAEVVVQVEMVVEVLLSKPTRMRKGYASQVLENLIEEPHFLADEEETVSNHAASVSARLYDDAREYLFRKLIERCDEVMADPERAGISRRSRWFLKALVREANADLTNQEWQALQLTQECSVSGPLLLSEPEVYVRLDSQAQSMVRGKLLDAASAPEAESASNVPSSGRSIDRSSALGRLRALEESELVAPGEVRELARAVEGIRYSALAEEGMPLTLYVERLLGDLKVHDWYWQNPACKALRNLPASEIAALANSDQEALGRNVLQAAHGSTIEAERFLAYLRRNGGAYPRSFLSGILLEALLSEQGEFRVKSTVLEAAVRVCTLSSEAEGILVYVANRIAAATSSDGRYAKEFQHGDEPHNPYQEAISRLHSIQLPGPTNQGFSRLIESIEGLRRSGSR